LNPEIHDPLISENEVEFPSVFGSIESLEPILCGACANAAQHNGSETILFVEDETFVRSVAAEVLESAGYRVIVAGSAAEALQASRNCSPPIDLLVADVVLPGMNGRKLAEHLEALHPSARILLISGYPEQLALCEVSSGNGKFLAKPFSIHSLLRAVRDALDQAHPCARAQA
jgi:two-component system cell cycle sensor histidine kinase/response regulator CckA